MHDCLKRLFNFLVTYVSSTGTYCPDGEDVTTEEGCREAATYLSIPFSSSFSADGDHKYCLYADDGRNEIFFNTSPSPGNFPTSEYGSVCQKQGKEG